MAKTRVSLKNVSKTIDRLTKDLKALQKKPAPAARREADAIHRKLARVKTIIEDCPSGLYRMFDVEAPVEARRRPPAKKSARRSRKGR